MPELKDCYEIKNKNGDFTRFHLVNCELIPLKNFELAFIWYLNDMLIDSSFRDLETLLSNSKIKKTCRKLLKETDRIAGLSLAICEIHHNK